MKATLRAYENKALFKKQGIIIYKLFGKFYMRKAAGSYSKKPGIEEDMPQCLIAANEFAKKMIANPVTKMLYQQKAKGKCSAYAKAVSEYMLTH